MAYCRPTLQKFDGRAAIRTMAARAAEPQAASPDSLLPLLARCGLLAPLLHPAVVSVAAGAGTSAMLPPPAAGVTRLCCVRATAAPRLAPAGAAEAGAAVETTAVEGATVERTAVERTADGNDTLAGVMPGSPARIRAGVAEGEEAGLGARPAAAAAAASGCSGAGFCLAAAGAGLLLV